MQVADHPRIRGEHRGDGSPPSPGGRIIPAYAGSTSAPASASGSGADHPRIRGEHIDRWDDRVQALGSSPHTRGARRHRHSTGTEQRIIPAYAGSTRGAAERRRHHQDHPRIRGEHVAPDTIELALQGSSPHTRGARTPTSAPTRHTRIIPAYAGSTPGDSPTPWSRGDHPRIRGEHSDSAFV